MTAIPRVFHQIWIGSAPFPDEYRKFQKTWLRHNPGWTLRLWTEDDLPSDLVRHEIYEKLRQPAERSDLLRLELLHRFGGVYLDADFECRRPLEPHLEGVELFAADLKPGRVNNAIMGAVAGHPFFDRAIREARPRATFGVVDKHGTGPLFIGRLLADFPAATIFDWSLFYPRTPEQERTAIAVHHHARSWQDEAGLRRYVQKLETRIGLLEDELDGTRAERDRERRRAETLQARLRGERTARWRRRFGVGRP